MSGMHCALSRLMPTPDDAERAKRLGWRNDRILVVSLDDRRLSPVERTAVMSLGQKLYEEPKGKR